MDPYDAALSAVYRLDRHDQILNVLHLRTSMSRKHRHVMSLTLTRPGGDDERPRHERSRDDPQRHQQEGRDGQRGRGRADRLLCEPGHVRADEPGRVR